MRLYERQVAIANHVSGERSLLRNNSTFVWPALFLGPIWLLYRKMWGWAIGIMVLSLVFVLLPLPGNSGNVVGIAIGVGLGTGGGLLYVNDAIRKLEMLRAGRGGAYLELQEVAATGGVSAAAACIGGILYLVLAFTIAFVASVVEHPGR